ncbi:chromate transporter, chromate ion transporter (CHR) family [Oligella urethralis]|uniref:chromate efflux transporter n=1 Tax=Oligella urethralis TaxID=90245 RepID=UPI000DF8CBE5|nr:chromate efflux transporter [Oligella urethralis]SUA94300.1 chromate transporter, chromate ion transporter (CHR) family [Oligella urethralis]
MSTNSPWSVFLIFLRLGLTSFGGPVAHLGYFRDELIVRRRWMTEQQYADLIALCHFLPGPSSSQVGMGLGISQAGYAGAFAAWLGFTMPSALLLILIAYAINSESALLPPSVLHGLAIVAVAVISQAVWGMGRSLCPDKSRFTLMIAATCYLLLFPSTWGQILVMLLAALVGVVCFKPETQRQDAELKNPMLKRHGLLFLSLFFILLLVLPLTAKLLPNQALILFDAFYRAGSLVFGGGHVMLPLLQAETVPSGLVSAEAFMAGYGATQAVPGPLFTFAAFLGASMHTAYGPFITGMLCLLAIFLPSFLLVLGALPFWESLRRLGPIRAALMGVNVAVVGLRPLQ